MSVEGAVHLISTAGISGWVVIHGAKAACVELQILVGVQILWQGYVRGNRRPSKRNKAPRPLQFRVVTPHVLELSPQQMDLLTVRARRRFGLWRNIHSGKKANFLMRLGHKRKAHTHALRFQPTDELKPKRVFYCKENNSNNDYVLKIAQSDKCIEKYTDIYKKYDAQRGEFERLYLPRYVERWKDFDVWECVSGYCYNWTELSSRIGGGGRTVPLATVEQIISLSEDLDRLGVITDFYWRNFVFLDDGKIAYVDSDVLADGYSDFRLAYLWCLMFSNDPWRSCLVKQALNKGLIELGQFKRQVGAIIDKGVKSNPVLWEQILASSHELLHG